MLAKTLVDINNIRAGILRIGKLSDNVVGVGRFGIGLGGVLAWIPVLGPLYSLAAGSLLLVSGFRARVPASVLAASAGLLGVRTIADSFADLLPPPLSAAPDVAIDLFRAHKWAADMMVKAIDDTLYIEGRPHSDNPDYVQARTRVRSGQEKRRLVVLG